MLEAQVNPLLFQNTTWSYVVVPPIVTGSIWFGVEVLQPGPVAFNSLTCAVQQLPAQHSTAQYSTSNIVCCCAGNPKGVVLTHHTLVTAVASLQGFVDLGNIKMGPNDSFLSFLTLAHIFDRVVEEFMLSVGGHIGYWQVSDLLLHSD